MNLSKKTPQKSKNRDIFLILSLLLMVDKWNIRTKTNVENDG